MSGAVCSTAETRSHSQPYGDDASAQGAKAKMVRASSHQSAAKLAGLLCWCGYGCWCLAQTLGLVGPREIKAGDAALTPRERARPSAI